MIIGLSGHAGAGKDTVADYLVENYGFKKVAFADEIRAMLLEIDPIVGQGMGNWKLSLFIKTYGWDEFKSKPEMRAVMQRFGMAARERWGADFWIQQLLPKLDGNVVVSDVRFKNEADTLRAWGASIWRIERDVKHSNHVSETELDNYGFDAVIHNNFHVQALYALVNDVLDRQPKPSASAAEKEKAKADFATIYREAN